MFEEEKQPHIKVLDTSCTEVWLGVRPDNTQTLWRDGKIIATINSDTVLIDNGLTPSTTYTYLLKDEQVKATTMDTTSHNFTTQVFEFGGESGYGNSSFSDVSIIDESNIWVSGDIPTTDGNFNATHWNGKNWELVKIRTNACGGVLYPSGNTVFSFAQNEIIFGFIDGSMSYNNNSSFVNDCSLINKLNGSLRKIWGTDQNNLYVISGNGFIAHFSEQNWKKIESGTTENIQDIWGSYNPENDKNFILCATSQIYRQSENLLLEINSDNTVSRFYWPFGDRKPYSVWFKNKRKIFTCGSYMMTRTGSGEWETNDSLSNYFMYKVRGSNLNNIFTVGGYGYIAHFNGKTWKELPTLFDGNYVSVDVKDNIAVAVGYSSRSARLIMLTRND